MSISRTNHRVGAWRVVERPDQAGDGPPPDDPASDDGGGRDPRPLWTTHLLAFLCGGMAFGALLVLPIAVPVVAFAAVTVFAAYSLRRDAR